MPGPILESQGMRVIFQKKHKENVKKYLRIQAKIYKILKYFEKGQVIACHYRTQQTTRKGSGIIYACLTNTLKMTGIDLLTERSF